MTIVPMFFIFVGSLLGSAMAQANVFHARQEAQTTADPSYSSLYTSCTNYAASCPPILNSCVSNFCTSCASLGGSDFVSCCGESTAAGCFSTLLLGTTTLASNVSGTQQTASITNAATLSSDPYSSSCFQAFAAINSCAVQTPGFTTLDDGDQASCLCYSGSTYDPGAFDQLQSACVSYASTADPGGVSVYSAAAGLCTRVGNVRHVTATISISESAAPSPTNSIPVETRTLSSTTSSTQSTSSAAATGGAPVQNVAAGWLLLPLLWLL